jgi:redox-sensing transcriptional repressor
MSHKSAKIPQATIQRMGVYIQVLEGLLLQEQQVISSEKLAEQCEVNPSQIRKDLAYFGEFGVRGVGYYVSDLLKAIKYFLGIDRNWNCILVGVGNLGRALLRHRQLAQKGFQIQMAFDCDPFKIGERVAGHEVICTRRLKEKAQQMQIDIGLISTPPERAQRAANHMMQAGIKGIVNFAPTRINVSKDVIVDYVDFSHHLISMAFRLSHP